MPVIRNRVIRNIPEQVAKNTSDILALKGGFDYSQSPFLGASLSYDADYNKMILTFNFVKNVIPVLIFCEFVTNGIAAVFEFSLRRKNNSLKLEEHYSHLDSADPDLSYTSGEFSLTNSGLDHTELSIYFDMASEPYDACSFENLYNAQFIYNQGEFDQ